MLLRVSRVDQNKLNRLKIRTTNFLTEADLIRAKPRNRNLSFAGTIKPKIQYRKLTGEAKQRCPIRRIMKWMRSPRFAQNNAAAPTIQALTGTGD
jgi:hypothetical protein